MCVTSKKTKNKGGEGMLSSIIVIPLKILLYTPKKGSVILEYTKVAKRVKTF